ncbi:hypothetical protein VB711_18160 [Cronbergia sp. UHCC 0137]|uniref:hypothetical protein n=1 Tax=Cronbergia sp. UHCC 0137 TaxID=3110239 RepID=UPI002B20830C|nr:hypothetical protein [Cronbergia sp. UHCC 0137]MEA5619751.1 hypothetical protein [Cronbergia sp. UHCC 0137]
MLNLADKVLLNELSLEEAANINGGQSRQGSQRDEEEKSSKSRYLKALGLAYLAPPGIGSITDQEALLAQKVAFDD